MTFQYQTQLERIEAKLDLLLEQKKPKSRKRVTENPDFDMFWNVYPVKKGKQAALRAFNNRKKYISDSTDHGLVKTRISVELLRMDIGNRLENDAQWIEGYIPHAATYLNGERWNDEITPVVTQAETMPKSNDELTGWAQEKRLREARPGESMAQYRQALTELYRNV